MTLFSSCSSVDCPFSAWRVCECCHQPYCNFHATWRREAVEHEGWATFAFVCDRCLARTGGKDGWPNCETSDLSEPGECAGQ